MLSDIGLTVSTKAVRTVAKDSVFPRLVTPVGVRCDLWATEVGVAEQRMVKTREANAARMKERIVNW